jgi:glutamine transport system substrate-binding protein
MQWIARLSLLYMGVAVFVIGCAPNNTLKVGIESNFKPFTYTESGEPKGFEVELWEAMAKKANIKYELVTMDVAEMSKSLKSGDVDLAIAGMTVNKARKDALDFSDPYFQTGLVLVVAKDNNTIQGKKDLKDKTVATQLGSTAYVYAGNISGVKEVRGYPEIEQAYDDLADKKIDAVIFDERNVHEYLQNQGKDKVKMVGEPLNKESYAIVSKKHSKHIGRVNDAIAAVVKDGTYEALYEKYFGSKPKKLPGD